MNTGPKYKQLTDADMHVVAEAYDAAVQVFESRGFEPVWLITFGAMVISATCEGLGMDQDEVLAEVERFVRDRGGVPQ